MKIRVYKRGYMIELDGNTLYVLNRKSLVWQLKNVFGIGKIVGPELMRQLDEHGQVELERAA